VKKETDKLDHPTIFAWHGSELGNWHSIVRQGLHFNKTTNGRAYGHGVYHAKDFVTSNGYSRAGGAAWPQSILEVTTAVALSEVINAPTKFISQNPYYVIQHIDWIQTRYLFVSPKSKLKLCEDALLPAVLSQDPTRTPTGLTGIPIKLPLNAISRSRWPRDVRKANRSRTSISADDDDTMSVTTQDEDTMALLEPSVSVTPQKRSRPVDDSVLPFVPGQLESLPLTNGPSYASAGTTRRLQKDFQGMSSGPMITSTN
jgi:ubiquitin-conjugating enzyme E2 Q